VSRTTSRPGRTDIGAFRLLYGATAHDRAVLMARIVGAISLLVGLLGFVSPDSFGLMPIGGAADERLT